jgi:formylmethanofuran dehydrogenase subunit E-like metal-binding protein
MDNTVENQLKDLKGSFVTSLRRNNKQIRDDRALAIAEDAEMIFKREVEDINTELKRLKRERESMLDLGGNNVTTIISQADFHAKEFVAKDLDLGLKIRNLEIKQEIASKRYNELFKGEDE